MEYKRISEINFKENLNQRVFGIFLARDISVRTQKDGVKQYIDFNMCDKDTVLNIKRFGATKEEIESLVNGHVYCGAIDIKEYKGDISCILYNFDKSDADPSLFVNWISGIDEASKTIQSALTMLNGTVYSKLAYNLITENWEKFTIWTAASNMHHNALGGLLVHTAEVIEQSIRIADMWREKYGEKFINMELLVTGAMLHDLAKVKELNVDKLSGTTEYATIASLETHITMCITMIDVEAYKLGIGYQVLATDANGNTVNTKTDDMIEREKEQISLLKHVIIAHHGKKEYGSPIEGSCPEATIINIADNLSAEMFKYNRAYKSMEPKTSTCVWVAGNMVTTYKESIKQ